MSELLRWDTELFLLLNSLGSEAWDKFWLAISATATWIPLYAILIFMLARHFKGWLLFWGLLLVVFNLFLTDQGSTWFFKEQFERLRPCHVAELQDQMRLVKAGCGGRYGFLSAHAANTFGMALLVGWFTRKRWPWLMPVLFCWAAIVAYSRIYIGVHYPLDVICGALYGMLCATLFYRIFQKLILPFYRESD